MPRIGWRIFLSRCRRGSASNAATISNPSFPKPRYESRASPRCPTPTKIDRLQARRAEFVGDFFRQIRHVITEAARAEGAEISEVLAQLGGFDAGGLGERLAGNGADAVLAQPRQTTEINRETINRLARNDCGAFFFKARRN